MKKHLQIIREIDTKEAEKAQLLTELKRSLALERMWPGVFDNGAVKAHWFGNAHNGLKYVVTAGNGEQREFSEAMVHDEIYLTLPVGRVQVLKLKNKYRRF
jgi:hypothetical protein